MPAPPKRPEEDESSLPSPKQPVPNRVPAGPGKLSRNKGRLMPSLPEDQELHPPSPMQSGECFRLRHVRVEALLQDGTLGLLLHGTSVVGFCSEEAASHGWFVGDQIVEINGKRVAAFDEFLEQFLAAQVQGFPIVFSVLRREAPEETPDEDPLESFFSEIDFVDLAGRLKKKFGGGSPGKAELASTGSSGDAILENPYIQALRRRRTELSKSPEGWSEESQSLAAKMATERGDALATLSRASTDTPRRFERRAGLLDWSLCIMRPCHEKEVVDELRTTPRMDYDYEAPKWLAKNKVAMPNAVVLSARGQPT